VVSAAIVDLEQLADKLLEQADDLEPDEDDVDDQVDDEPPAALLGPSARRHPPRRSVADPTMRPALLDLVGYALEAKIASELEDDDRAVRALDRTACRAAQLAEELRARLALSDPVPSVP
jgi:hypothetical protein